jgi:uncharacterized protein YbjT (DUF2867 family)
LSKSALVLGSTGLVGNHLLNILRSKNGGNFSFVYAAVRKIDPNFSSNGTVQQIKVDYENLGTFAKYLSVDVVFCCLGTTIKVAGAKERFRRVDFDYVTGVAKLFSDSNPNGHFILVSALGADEGSAVFYSKVKGEVEAYLKALPLRRVTILRPSLLLGDRAAIRPGEKTGEVASTLLKPLMIGPLRKYRAIKAESVAKAMVSLSQNSETDQLQIYESDKIQELADQPL